MLSTMYTTLDPTAKPPPSSATATPAVPDYPRPRLHLNHRPRTPASVTPDRPSSLRRGIEAASWPSFRGVTHTRARVPPRAPSTIWGTVRGWLVPSIRRAPPRKQADEKTHTHRRVQKACSETSRPQSLFWYATPTITSPLRNFIRYYNILSSRPVYSTLNNTLT